MITVALAVVLTAICIYADHMGYEHRILGPTVFGLKIFWFFWVIFKVFSLIHSLLLATAVVVVIVAFAFWVNAGFPGLRTNS